MSPHTLYKRRHNRGVILIMTEHLIPTEKWLFWSLCSCRHLITRHLLMSCNFSRMFLLRVWRSDLFSAAVTLNWRAAEWERRSAITTASKASRAPSPSPTAWLMASGTRSLSPSAPPTSCCTSTVTGKDLPSSPSDSDRLSLFAFPTFVWGDVSNELSVFIKVNICFLAS